MEVKGDDCSIETVWLIGEGVGVENLRKGDGGLNCVELKAVIVGDFEKMHLWMRTLGCWICGFVCL